MSRSVAPFRGPLAVLASVVLSAAAQLLMKGGMLALERVPVVPGHDSAYAATALAPVVIWVAAGLACYGTSMLCWLMALSKYDLSVAYPLLSLSYALVYIVSVHWPYFAENPSASRTLGTIVIMIGVSLVAGTTALGNAPIRSRSRDQSVAGA
jgi:undecaprenyl phosphate-alpha-L-ara4N flippase subunit ArnF